MYTHREALYKTLYYQLYGEAPVYLPDDVENAILDVQQVLTSRAERGLTDPIVSQVSVLRRK